jgi:hypothetical protein
MFIFNIKPQDVGLLSLRRVLN